MRGGAGRAHAWIPGLGYNRRMAHPPIPAARAAPARRSRLLLWAGVALYLGTIFLLSSLPSPLPALTSRMSDKALHAVEYGGLALLLGLALGASGLRAGRAAALALLLASLYGASDELHQAFVPHRASDVRDWIADTAGAALGAAAAAGLARRRAPAEGPAAAGQFR